MKWTNQTSLVHLVHFVIFLRLADFSKASVKKQDLDVVKHQYNDLDTLENEYKDSYCDRKMFGNDSNSFWACITQYALQRNWYPSPIGGLFTYQAWNGFDGFWQDGCLLEAMANFGYYGNNSRYHSVLLSSWRSLDMLREAYYPTPSFDDEGWYGLSYARIYEVTGNSKFLHTSLAIYDWCWQSGWDYSGECHGGFWFDTNYSYKGTITNVQMLQLGAKLYRLTKKKDYLDKVAQIFAYIMGNTILDMNTFLVADSINSDSCAPNTGSNKFTYESGVLIGGLVEMSKIYDQHSSYYLELAQKVALSNMYALSPQGVLLEYCDMDNQCAQDNGDAKMFKGIFVRNLRYLMVALTKEERKPYQVWLEFNIKSLIEQARCQLPIQHCKISYQDGHSKHPPQGPVFTVRWTGPFNYSAPMQQTMAFELFTSAILPGTSCQGQGCTFDPPTSSSNHLTCDPDPCPRGHACCSWADKYATCCMPGQTCNNGGCY